MPGATSGQSWEAWKGFSEDDLAPSHVGDARMRISGGLVSHAACLADGITPALVSAEKSEGGDSLSHGGNISPSGPACSKARTARKVGIPFLGIPS